MTKACRQECERLTPRRKVSSAPFGTQRCQKGPLTLRSAASLQKLFCCVQGRCETGETLNLSVPLCTKLEICRTSTEGTEFLLDILHCHSLPPACWERGAEALIPIGSLCCEWQKDWRPHLVFALFTCRSFLMIRDRLAPVVPQTDLEFASFGATVPLKMEHFVRSQSSTTHFAPATTSATWRCTKCCACHEKSAHEGSQSAASATKLHMEV